jgi:hypothetical protein
MKDQPLYAAVAAECVSERLIGYRGCHADWAGIVFIGGP